jgi:hypothetical protein
MEEYRSQQDWVEKVAFDGQLTPDQREYIETGGGSYRPTDELEDES